MMGRLNHDQRQLFYSFCLDEVVPDDHLVRAIASVLIYRGFIRTSPPTIPRRAVLDRSGADDPDADRWLCLRNPLRTGAMPIRWQVGLGEGAMSASNTVDFWFTVGSTYTYLTVSASP